MELSLMNIIDINLEIENFENLIKSIEFKSKNSNVTVVNYGSSVLCENDRHRFEDLISELSNRQKVSSEEATIRRNEKRLKKLETMNV